MKKNIFKKIVASLATVAMAAGLFTAMPAEEAKAAEEATKYAVNVTVKGEKADEMVKDGKLNLYYWGDGTVVSAPGWPGNAMTKNDDGSWSLKDIAVTGKFNLIVNGNGQTVDVKDVNVKKDIYVTVGAKEGEKYTATVTYGTEDAPEFKGEIVEPEKKDIKVYVKLDAELDFDKVCFHRWNTGLTDPSWPGMELTDDNGIYTGTFQVEKSITKIGGQVNCGSNVFEANADITDLSTGEIYITVKADKTTTVTTTKPADWVTSGGNTEDGKTEDGKTEDGKTEDGKTEDGKTEDGKTEDGKTEDGKTEDGKTEDGKTEDDKTEEKGVTVEVTLDPSIKWEEVYIHAWGDGFETKWPGVKMTAKDGKWYATLDTELAELSFVINAGKDKEQTANIEKVSTKNAKITVTAEKNEKGHFVASAGTVAGGGSAKPGDNAPVAIMFAVAAVAAGMVVASKKKTICE